MTSTQYRTPSVHVTETDAFSPSVVGIQTAVPAFIGYTEAASLNGQPVMKRPVMINSMAEFQATFGGAYKPKFQLAKVADGQPGDIALGNNGYTLALPSSLKFHLYNSLRLYYANGGGACYVVSIGNYSTSVDVSDFTDGLDVIKNQPGPTILVAPDATLLTSAADFGSIATAMISQCAEMQDRVAILDVFGADKLDQLSSRFSTEMDKTIESFRSAVGTEQLKYGMAYFPFLNCSIVQASEFDLTSFDLSGDALKVLTDALAEEVAVLYPASGGTAASKRKEQINGLIAKIISPPADLTDPDKQAEAQNKWKSDLADANKSLSVLIPKLVQIYALMARIENVLPPSAAMAGVYCSLDASRGVWNAPTNVSLNGVVGPTLKLTASTQGDLNTPVDGKSINAIHDFVGRGTLVWGARTLDGNSNDWRYIQTRRTMIYIQQSIKLALEKFVFAPNNGQSWVTVTAMISNFLKDLWSQGGLIGAMPKEAFTVSCGLGSTMTGQDVLNGYMKVQITLQMTRPAEFIELTFTQEMQGA